MTTLYIPTTRGIALVQSSCKGSSLRTLVARLVRCRGHRLTLLKSIVQHASLVVALREQDWVKKRDASARLPDEIWLDIDLSQPLQPTAAKRSWGKLARRFFKLDNEPLSVRWWRVEAGQSF